MMYNDKYNMQKNEYACCKKHQTLSCCYSIKTMDSYDGQIDKLCKKQ